MTDAGAPAAGSREALNALDVELLWPALSRRWHKTFGKWLNLPDRPGLEADLFAAMFVDLRAVLTSRAPASEPGSAGPHEN